jgi:hypothetical protein
MRTISVRGVCRCLVWGRVPALAVAAATVTAMAGASPGMASATAAAHRPPRPAASAGRSGLLGQAPAGLPAVRTFPTKGGILFGGNDGLADLTTQLGRNMAIDRTYYKLGGGTFPSFTDNAHMAAGSTLLVSLDANGHSYKSIIAGTYDTQISTFLTAVNAAAVKYDFSAIFITFQHEPDDPTATVEKLGTPAQFIEAWDHVHQLAASADLDWNQNAGGRLVWTLILVHNSYAMGTNAKGYWPGSSVVDAVAADGYNAYGCKAGQPNQKPAEIFGPLLSFAKANGGLPVIIAEWASNAALASNQAKYIKEMQTYLTDNHKKIKAAMYWDDSGPLCSFKIDTNPASIAAMKVLGASADMQGTAHMG